MSFFKSVLSKVGIGATKVDTILDDHHVCPGGLITGCVTLRGGQAEQTINKIDLAIKCDYFKEVEYETENEEHEIETVKETYTLASFEIREHFTILPDEVKSFPFSINLPLTTPLSLGQSKTWLETNLDIDFALDKQDKDYLLVQATPVQYAVIEAMHELGFQLHEAECEATSAATLSHLPFIQELEFKPISGDYFQQLDEVELVFAHRHDGKLDVLFEIDRRARGLVGFFMEVLELDESKARLTIDASDIDQIQDKVEQQLDACSSY